MIPDAELIAEYRASQSEQVFSQIVERHGPMVLRTCLRLVGNREDAEEATQAVFQILARRSDIVGTRMVEWLYGVARRMAYRSYRTRSRRTRHEETARMRSTEPDDVTILNELREELDLVLEQLPAKLQEAVILRYLEGWSQEEAAVIAGCSRKTIVQRSQDGLTRLRALFGHHRGKPVSTGVLLALLVQESSAARPNLPPGSLDLSTILNLPNTSLRIADMGERPLRTPRLAAGAVVVATLAFVGALWLGQGFVNQGAAQSGAATAATGSALSSPEGLTLKGHGGEVYSLAFSNDGLRLASAGADGMLKLWHLADGTELASRHQGDDTRLTLSFSADGQDVEAFDSTGRRRAWNARSLRVIDRQQAFAPDIYNLGAFPDGLLQGLLRNDGALKLWQGSREWTFAAPEHGRVATFQISWDGQWVVAGFEDGTIKQWAFPEGTERFTLSRKLPSTTHLFFAPGDRTLVAGTSNGSLTFWNVATGEEKSHHQAHPGAIRSFSFSRDGRLLATLDPESGVKLWDVPNGELKGNVNQDTVAITSVEFSPSGKYLALGGSDGTIRIMPIPYVERISIRFLMGTPAQVGFTKTD